MLVVRWLPCSHGTLLSITTVVIVAVQISQPEKPKQIAARAHHIEGIGVSVPDGSIRTPRHEINRRKGSVVGRKCVCRRCRRSWSSILRSNQHPRNEIFWSRIFTARDRSQNRLPKHWGLEAPPGYALRDGDSRNWRG